VNSVLTSTNPRDTYLGLNARDKALFEDRLFPNRDVPGQPFKPSDTPPHVNNSQTLPQGYECWDRQVDVVTYSKDDTPLYRYSAVGYWCSEHGLVLERKTARRRQSQILHSAWRSVGLPDYGADSKGNTANIGGRPTFALANIVTVNECARIVARVWFAEGEEHSTYDGIAC